MFLFAYAEVVLAHADCTHSKDIMKRTFNLEGFPGFLFWRQQSGSLDEVVDKMFAVYLEACYSVSMALTQLR